MRSSAGAASDRTYAVTSRCACRDGFVDRAARVTRLTVSQVPLVSPPSTSGDPSWATTERIAAAPAVDPRSPTAAAAPGQAPGRRKRAPRRSGSRGALFRGLPSAPILLGVAALAVSAGGAVTAARPGLSAPRHRGSPQASALSGASDATGEPARPHAPPSAATRGATPWPTPPTTTRRPRPRQQAKQRNAALAKSSPSRPRQQAAKIALNQWLLPVDGYHLTARFGESAACGRSYHTGLDFAAPSGTPIHAVANGVITSTGYDGAYGNKTVETLDDGTELWYCHQTVVSVVSVGDTVRAGQLIGYVGSTGNVTGPHLHLEVRPGGGDPVDPYRCVHGLQRSRSAAGRAAPR